MDILKSGKHATQATGTPSAEDLALIHKHTRKNLPAEELYVFNVTLCDNRVDRDGERFTTQCLHALAPMFVGKTGMFDHSGKSGDQTMRIYHTQVEEHGEYACLCAKVYLPRNAGNATLIADIDAGIKKEVSVACAVKNITCSVCGKGMHQCTHKRGQSYGGAVCHAVLEEPTDAYEFSFVAVPAQPAAGVRKKAAKREAAYIAELERLAEDGRAYRAQLLEKTLQAGAAAMPEMDRALLAAMVQPLPTQQLKLACDTLRAKAKAALPLCGQLVNRERADTGDNEGFRV
ncbi:MAG: hypothetical protein FWE40_02015 [Oscillospiraceae bacterium]|nr:hypothetical protein [Oscillospiraceae bacterium]